VLMLANDAVIRIGRSDLEHFFLVNQQNKSLIEDVRVVLHDPGLVLEGLGLTPSK